VSPAIAQEPASETEQETGGTIDLKADEQPDGETSPVTAEEHRASRPGTQKNNATLPGVNQNGVREPNAKHIAGGAH
jgi:hypothetical protein